MTIPEPSLEQLDRFLAALVEPRPPGWSNPDPWTGLSHWIPEASRAMCGISYYRGERFGEPPQGAAKCPPCEASLAACPPGGTVAAGAAPESTTPQAGKG